MCVPGTENSETVPTNGLWMKTGLLSFWSSTNISMVVGFSSRSPLGDNAKALSYTRTHTQYKYNRKCVRIKYHCACHKHPTMEAWSAEQSWKLNLNWTYFLRSFKFWLIHRCFFFQWQKQSSISSNPLKVSLDFYIIWTQHVLAERKEQDVWVRVTSQVIWSQTFRSPSRDAHKDPWKADLWLCFVLLFPVCFKAETRSGTHGSS